MEAARLRTLPLSISGIIVGNGLAYLTGHFSSLIFLFSLLTTIAFQILSTLQYVLTVHSIVIYQSIVSLHFQPSFYS